MERTGVHFLREGDTPCHVAQHQVAGAGARGEWGQSPPARVSVGEVGRANTLGLASTQSQGPLGSGVISRSLAPGPGQFRTGVWGDRLSTGWSVWERLAPGQRSATSKNCLTAGRVVSLQPARCLDVKTSQDTNNYWQRLQSGAGEGCSGQCETPLETAV